MKYSKEKLLEQISCIDIKNFLTEKMKLVLGKHEE